VAPVDVLVCDMNVHPKMACALMISIADLLKTGGVLVLTLKTIEHGLANHLERLPEVILKPTGLFDRIETRWLFANGKERTCLATRSSLVLSSEQLSKMSKDLAEADPYVMLGLKKNQEEAEIKESGAGQPSAVVTKRKLNPTVHSWLKQHARQSQQLVREQSEGTEGTEATEQKSKATNSDETEKLLSKRQQRKMQRRQEVLNRILSPSPSP